MTRAAYALLVLAGLGLLLAGCGFKLQGSRALPEELQRVFIDSTQRYSVDAPEVETALRARLRRRGAVVTGDTGSANAVLALQDVKADSEVLSVGTDGRAIEYEILVEATFSLRDDSGLLVGPETLKARRALSFPTEQILPKEAEEERLKDYLQEELAELILLQLEARLTARASTPP